MTQPQQTYLPDPGQVSSRHGHRKTLTLFSPPGSPRTCRWADVCAKSLSHVQLFVIPQTVACQAPLSMSFSRQEYWSGLPCPPPGDLPHPGMEPVSLTSFALAGGFFTTSATWEASLLVRKVKVKSLSHVPLFATPWTVAYQVLLPMGFSRQEY